jgi:protein SCO1/2
MRSIQEALADRPEVDLVSFSIDPANDTPAKLAEYAQQVGAGPKWHFLTGERAITARVANDGFLFALSPDASNFDHSDRIALVDAQGMVRGWFDSYSPKLVEEVRSLMRSL